MKTKSERENKMRDRNIVSKANNVSDAYKYIMDGCICEKKSEDEVTDCDIQEGNQLINPDPHSMNYRG